MQSKFETEHENLIKPVAQIKEWYYKSHEWRPCSLTTISQKYYATPINESCMHARVKKQPIGYDAAVSSKCHTNYKPTSKPKRTLS